MANCPNCGSNHIHLKRETDVNWGRAVAGWALFGVVGGAVGAVTGEDRNVNACLDCGTSWRATDLYKTLQIVKNLTGATLDLAWEEDRLYLNNFIAEISPELESISDVEKKAEKLIKDCQNKLNEKAAAGCGFGCLTSIAGCSAIASAASGGGILMIILLPPLIGVSIGMLLDLASKKSIEREIEKVKLETEKMKIQAQKKLQQKVIVFMRKQSY